MDEGPKFQVFGTSSRAVPAFLIKRISHVTIRPTHSVLRFTQKAADRTTQQVFMNSPV